jgi:hypothetical protein
MIRGKSGVESNSFDLNHIHSPSAAALLFYHVSHENATVFGDLRRKSSLLTNRCENHGRNLQLLQTKFVSDEKLAVPNVTTI